jgi:hypothetical protein
VPGAVVGGQGDGQGLRLGQRSTPGPGPSPDQITARRGSSLRVAGARERVDDRTRLSIVRSRRSPSGLRTRRPRPRRRLPRRRSHVRCAPPPACESWDRPCLSWRPEPGSFVPALAGGRARPTRTRRGLGPCPEGRRGGECGVHG